ncbi:hypothetical protein OsJ_06419 [Oryza sativa Japonica Group]|uniref:Uncharacterized protein n=1 Tax=Oryza sativa subsp. japonica TaxID=39947 RepID=B9F590_ORYSJ|nr:hypothetical protein OsJ_06419 [Oryza sativa Japonica Group]
MPLSLPPVSYNHFRLTKKERWVARVDGEDGGPVLADLGEGVDEEDLNEARLAAGDGVAGWHSGEIKQPWFCESITLVGASREILINVAWKKVISNDKILKAMTSNGKLKDMFAKILHSLPANYGKEKHNNVENGITLVGASREILIDVVWKKVIFNDKILEAMTSNGKLKDMFAKILHSLPANYGKEKHNNVENGKLRMFMWINYSQSGYVTCIKKFIA